MEEIQMSDTTVDFLGRLDGLVALAKKNKGVLEIDKLNDFFKEFNLDVDQVDKIYEHLESNNIVVLEPAELEDEPNEEALLELEQDVPEEFVEDEFQEDLSAVTAAMSDDPV
ncbi:MAG: polymerase primary sigma factor, partial [Clostridiales bacterium]|nr:polymerase primary sigma factor [Clostridiales bacterium]